MGKTWPESTQPTRFPTSTYNALEFHNLKLVYKYITNNPWTRPNSSILLGKAENLLMARYNKKFYQDEKEKSQS